MSFSGLATALINQLGVAGIALGVFLNGLGIPGLSEVLLPLTGIAVKEGQQNLVVVFAVAMAAQLLGYTAAYLIARYGGIALVEKYGKYVLISSRELEATHRAFDKYGNRLVVVGAFVPGLQGFVGYVAGIARMNYAQFIVSAFVGKLVWIGGLLYIGSVLGGHLALIDRSIKLIGMIVLAALIVAGVWYLRKHKNNSQAARLQKEK